MTVTVTTDRTGPLIADSADPLPFTFQAIVADGVPEIEVYLDDVLVDPNDYTVVLNGDGTGSVVPLDPWDGEVYILSAPSFKQPFAFNRFVPVYPDQIVPPLDRLAKTIIALRNRLSRGLPQIGNIITGAAGGAAAIVARLVGGQTYWDITLPTGEQGPAGDVAKAADRTELSETVAISGMVRYLAEGERSGSFVYDGSDLSAQVADDPLQAIYVAKASDPTGASGAWVRRYVGPKDPRWFGAVGNGVTDDHTALQAWLDSGGDLLLPPKHFYSSLGLIVRKQVHVRGGGFGFDARLVGGYSAMPGSRIRFADDVSASRLFDVQPQTPETDIATVLGTIIPVTGFSQEGAYGSTFRDFALIGPDTGVADGFYARTVVYLDNVTAVEFGGRGITLMGTADTPSAGDEYGNVSVSSVVNCTALSNGSHGFHMRGRDANTILIQNCNARANGGWGMLEEGLLGNAYIKNHVAGNLGGSFKSINTVNESSFVDNYIEGDSHAGAIVNSRNKISPGGNLKSANVPTDFKPWAVGGYEMDVHQVRFNWGWTIGAITGEAKAFRTVTGGLNLQGEGSSADLTFLNKSGTAVATVGTGGIAWSFKGNAGLDGVDPILSLRGSGGVGSQLLMAGGGVDRLQFYASNGGTVYASADTLVFRDKTTLTSTRLTIDANGLNLGSGKVLKVDGTQVIGARGAAIADVAMAVAAPTKAEYDALATAFNTLLARVRAATGHGLIA